MNKELGWYRFITKWLSPALAFSADFIKQLGIIAKERWRTIREVFKAFWKDVLSPKRSRSLAALVAFGVIVCWSVILPATSTYQWLSATWREWSLSYQEWPVPDESETWASVKAFADAYSNAYGSDCEWFRTHDTDILMWTEHRRLRRDSYPCQGFSQYSRAILFPISVGSQMRKNDHVTVDAIIGRVDYDHTGAERYTSIRASLWKLLDEGDWRINRMHNVQKSEFR
jgi:hypothetical protein